MDKGKLVINGVFYLVLTIFFIYLFIKEKELVEKIKVYKDRLSNSIIDKFGIKNITAINVISKGIHYTESIVTALILVLIIQRFYIGNFMVPTGSMIPTIIPNDRLFGNMVIYKFKKPQREDIVVFKEPIQNKVLYTKRLMGLPGEKIQIKDNHLNINGVPINIRKYSDLGMLEGKEWVIPKKGDKVKIIPYANYERLYNENKINVAAVQKDLKDNPGAVEQILPKIQFQVNGENTGMILDVIDKKEVIEKLFKGETIEVTLDEDYYVTLGDNTDSSYDSRFWGFVAESRIRGKAFVRFWPLNKMSLLK